MKFNQPQKKIKLFKSLTKGECFRFADIEKHGHGVYMKIWNGPFGVSDSLSFAVNIENGNVQRVGDHEKVFFIVIEAEEVTS